MMHSSKFSLICMCNYSAYCASYFQFTNFQFPGMWWFVRPCGPIWITSACRDTSKLTIWWVFQIFLPTLLPVEISDHDHSDAVISLFHFPFYRSTPTNVLVFSSSWTICAFTLPGSRFRSKCCEFLDRALSSIVESVVCKTKFLNIQAYYWLTAVWRRLLRISARTGMVWRLLWFAATRPRPPRWRSTTRRRSASRSISRVCSLLLFGFPGHIWIFRYADW